MLIPTDLTFRTSTYSDRSDCVAVADLPVGEGAVVCDSKHPERGHLPFPAEEWHAFLHVARV